MAIRRGLVRFLHRDHGPWASTTPQAARRSLWHPVPQGGTGVTLSMGPDIDGDRRQGVVAEDVDDLDADGAAS